MSQREKGMNLKTTVSRGNYSWASLRRAMRYPLRFRRRVSPLHYGETHPGPGQEWNREDWSLPHPSLGEDRHTTEPCARYGGDLVRLGRGVGLMRLYTVLNPSDHRDDV